MEVNLAASADSELTEGQVIFAEEGYYEKVSPALARWCQVSHTYFFETPSPFGKDHPS